MPLRVKFSVIGPILIYRMVKNNTMGWNKWIKIGLTISNLITNLTDQVVLPSFQQMCSKPIKSEKQKAELQKKKKRP